jgi:hypothetical protein
MQSRPVHTAQSRSSTSTAGVSANQLHVYCRVLVSSIAQTTTDCRLEWHDSLDAVFAAVSL